VASRPSGRSKRRPQGFSGTGVGKEDVKVGDKIKARCHLLRDAIARMPAGIRDPMHGDKARGTASNTQWD
jgi:hypothetical protein